MSSFPTKGLLDAAGTAFDYLCPHHYEVDDLAGEDRSFKQLRDWIAANAGGKDIRVGVTEWNTTAGDFGLTRGMLQTLGNALSVSRYLNLMQRYADLVEIANRSNFADSFGSGFVRDRPRLDLRVARLLRAGNVRARRRRLPASPRTFLEASPGTCKNRT